MKRIGIGLVLVILLSSLGLAACQPAASPSESIKIGALLPLTGALLQEGPNIRKGAELALEHYGGQVAGKKIELVIEDDATDPTIALDKARKLVERDKVDIMMVSLHAGAGQAVMPYLTEKKIIGIKRGTVSRASNGQIPLPIRAGGHKQTGDSVHGRLRLQYIEVQKSSYHWS